MCPICFQTLPHKKTCLKALVDQRDQARRIARACWRTEPDEGVPLSIQEEVFGDDSFSWLTEEGPEDIAARKVQQSADHAMMAVVFSHPFFANEA